VPPAPGQRARSPLPREAAPAEDLSVLDDLPALVRNYVRDSRSGERPVVEHLGAAELRRKLDLELGPLGLSDRELLPLLETYLRYAVRSAHPQFHNQLFSGFSLASFLGEVVAALTNTTMSTFEASPVGTLVEGELLSHMRALAGWEAGGGILCTGGSNANLLGMLCARQRAFPELSRTGRSAAQPQAFVSDQAHYSFAKAAKVLGIGADNLIAVQSDAQGRMEPTALESAVLASLSAGHRPFFVGATAGTTVLGAFDPLRPLAGIAASHGLWLHVDGSWGGAALLSPRWRGLLDGADLCDSLAWDAHKMMGANLACSAFLTPHAGALEDATAVSGSGSEYLLHEGEDAELDTGRSSLQCGRRVDALKLWLLWRRHGDVGLAARVDHLFELAERARGIVRGHARLELLGGGPAPNVCLRWMPAADADADAFNLQLRERLRQSGQSLVNYARLGGRLAIRLTLSNAELGAPDVARFFELLEACALELERERGLRAPGRDRSCSGRPTTIC
jgi:glutamate/tyrosine decarboxylase-like PLP-dependent enzyme